MEVTNALLVALLFITILTIGIGNVLIAIGTIIDRRSILQLDWMLGSWIFILLLLHLDLFWLTLTILEIENWGFSGFVYTVLGPMLLFLASHLLVSTPEDEIQGFSRSHYLAFERSFFAVLSLAMIWEVGLDATIGDGLTAESVWSLAGFALFATLATTKNERVHAAGTALAWVLLLALFVMRGMGAFA